MNKPVDYKQYDPRWGGNDYSARGEKTDIRESGCGPTCAAMLIATLAAPSITPADTCAWALRNGYKAPHSGTYYSYFGPQGRAYGLDWEQLNWVDLRGMRAAEAQKYHSAALAAVQNGDAVIACMGPGNWTRGGHFILWYGTEGEYALINDPASAKAERARNKISLLQQQVKYYFVCHVPADRKEQDMTKAEVQTMIAEALERQKEAAWYPTLDDVPGWYQPSVKKLMERGVLKGYDGGKDGSVATIADNTIRVDETFCRIITLLDKMGLL